MRSRPAFNRIASLAIAVAAFATAGAFAQGPPPFSDNPFGGSPAPGGPTPSLDGSGGPPALTPTAPGGARSLLAEPDAVRQLAYFRFVEEMRWDGKIIVKRKKLSFEESQAFDRERIAYFAEAARNNELPWYPATGADPQIWAEWSHYAEQLALWTDYCKGTLFADSPTEHGLKDIKFPGDPQPNAQGGSGGGGARGGRAGDEFAPSPENLVRQNQNKSIDSQAGEFFTFTPADGGNNQGAQNFKPSDMDDQAKTLYNNWIEEVRQIEEDQNKFIASFDARLTERNAARQAYTEWRKDQQVQMMDVVRDWERSYDGQIAVIEGVRYELYKPGNVPRAVPRGAHVVETNHSLTPFDILDENGRLLGAAGSQ